MNIIGGAAALVLLAFRHKAEKYEGCLHFSVGNNWGGVNLGLIIITDTTPTEHTLKHEYGHSIQNAFFGVFFPFIVGLPSFIRYWHRELQYCIGKPPKTDYDAVWYEGQATRLGNEYITKWK